MATDRAPLPRSRTRRPRHRAQTWPLPAIRARAAHRLLVALCFGAGAALIVFGLLLVVLPAVTR